MGYSAFSASIRVSGSRRGRSLEDSGRSMGRTDVRCCLTRYSSPGPPPTFSEPGMVRRLRRNGRPLIAIQHGRMSAHLPARSSSGVARAGQLGTPGGLPLAGLLHRGGDGSLTMVRMHLPSWRQQVFHTTPIEEVERSSVAQMASRLDERCPGISDRLLEPDRGLGRHVNGFWMEIRSVGRGALQSRSRIRPKCRSSPTMPAAGGDLPCRNGHAGRHDPPSSIICADADRGSCLIQSKTGSNSGRASVTSRTPA